MRSERASLRTLPDDQQRRIYRLYLEGVSIKELAERYGKSADTIGSIVRKIKAAERKMTDAEAALDALRAVTPVLRTVMTVAGVPVLGTALDTLLTLVERTAAGDRAAAATLVQAAEAHAQLPAPESRFAIGEKVFKVGLYSGPGIVRGALQLPIGLRYVVGHVIQGGEGEFVHVYSENNLRGISSETVG